VDTGFILLLVLDLFQQILILHATCLLLLVAGLALVDEEVEEVLVVLSTEHHNP
jgi:hypothetical protein